MSEESLNTIVVYDTTSLRYLHVVSVEKGIPTKELFDQTNYPDATSAIFDSTSMDYVVGVVNYDEDIWGNDDLLTDAACSELGIDTSEKEKFKKDLNLTIRETIDFLHDQKVLSDGTSIIGVDTTSPLSSVEKWTKLEIMLEHVSGGGLAFRGLDTDLGYGTYDPVTDINTDRLKVKVRKRDSNWTWLTGPDDNDAVAIMVSGGKIFGDYKKNLVNGVTEFYWQPPVGSHVATVTVFATGLYTPGQELRSDKQSILLLNYPDFS